jgi:hypothetical protein
MVPGRSTFDSMKRALFCPFMTVGSMKGGKLAGIGGDLREHNHRGLRAGRVGVRVAGEEALAVVLGEASDALG